MPPKERRGSGKETGKKLFAQGEEGLRAQQRKRKSNMPGETDQTLDLNLPVDSNAIVSVGLVNSRVSQLDGDTEASGESMIEKLKKQKRSGSNQQARSATAADDSPRRAQ